MYFLGSVSKTTYTYMRMYVHKNRQYNDTYKLLWAANKYLFMSVKWNIGMCQ